MSGDYLIFIAICLMNPTLTNVGMGFQKMSINHITGGSSGARRAGWFGVWFFGLALQIAVVFLALKALSIGNASTLGGFAGFGLVAISLFSYFALKEEILKVELLGMCIILAGTAALGYFGRKVQSPDVHLETHRMLMFFAVYLALVTAGIALVVSRREEYGGAVLGMIGGSMGGLGMVFMKIVTSAFRGAPLVSGATLAKAAAFPYTWLMAVGGIGGLALVQFGYKYGKAIQVVPGFTAMVIIFPVVAGIAVLGETVPPASLASVALITAGVIITAGAAPAASRKYAAGAK